MRRSQVLYLSQDFHQELYILYKRSGSVLSVLWYFTLTKVSTKHRSLVILVLLKALPPVCMKYTAQDESRSEARVLYL